MRGGRKRDLDEVGRKEGSQKECNKGSKEEDKGGIERKLRWGRETWMR